MSERLQATLTLPPEVLVIVASRAAELVSATADNGGYWTAKQAAAFLDCEPKRIYKLVRQGRLRQYKEGGRSLFLRSDVLGLVEDAS